MQLVVATVGMLNPQNIVLIQFQASEGHPLEIIHQRFFFLRTHRLTRSPRQNTCRVLPSPLLGINERTGHVRVASENFGRRLGTSRIVQPQEVMHRSPPRALAMRE